jgi:hypothetical protein
MNLISAILISLVKADSNSVYVILGGTSASNSYPLVNQSNISNSFSYNFKNNTWLPANNPMPGGDGNGSSIWPSLGESLQGDVYFYDCARINASIPEWSDTGKYYNWAQTCFNLAGNFSKKKEINYNVLWQEGPQDNRYSYDSNYFLNIIQRLIYNSGLNNNWYISVYTYGDNYGYRYDKIQDIIYLINNNNNVYLGANIDSGCFNEQNLSIPILSNYWLKSIIENNRNVNMYYLYNLCVGGYKFSNMLFVLSIIFIGISLIFGAIYSCKYYQRRKYYQQLQN